ncbi:SH3 and PX domain-containing protein 2A [Oopsacas minuta]|uniref:SH3 and PX domain-containing protein 2A n=1 Tax=Oopsacas minuta TaxID=111878 RepID=A0AAV7KG60_9METZ|nr:SH3 and PX domain-containing protein 2A [Oopsacas minuta]
MAGLSSKLGKLRTSSFNTQNSNVVHRNVVMDLEMDSQSKSRSMPNRYMTKPATDTYPRNARAIQVVESRRDKKRYLYKLSVDWSDGAFSYAYRSYTDFFNLQCKLLNTFPEEAGARKSVRTIPFLPGRQIFARNTRALAEQRRPAIDKYIIELLRLPEHLSRHQFVCHFFRNNREEDQFQEGYSPSKKAKHFSSDEDNILSDPLILESVDSIASTDMLI